MMNNILNKIFPNRQSLDKYERKAQRRLAGQKTLSFAAVFFRTFLLIGLCFVILLPIFQKFSYAFRHPMDITNPQVVWIPENWSTINFQIAGELLVFWSSLFNTTILSFFTMVIQIMAAAIAGYSFARDRKSVV